MIARLRAGVDADDGAYLIIYALLAVALFSMGAIVLDIATLRQDRTGDRLAADLAVTAGAIRLDPTAPGSAAVACQDAWDYFRDNVPASAVPLTDPGCALTFPPLLCTPVSPSVTAVGFAGPYRFEVTTPVPDGSALMRADAIGADRVQPGDPSIDGTQCERLAVRVVRTREQPFSAIVGLGARQTDVHSVARADLTSAASEVTELVVLDPTSCAALRTEDTLSVRVDGSGQTGDVAVDSDATGCGGASPVIDIADTTTLAARAGINPGIIRSAGLAGPFPTAAFDPADVASARLTPAPSPVLGAMGRSVVDRRYNCVAPGCAPGEDHVARLRADVGAGVPASYLGVPVLPYLGPCAVALPTVIPAGNWYLPCPVVTVTSTLTFTGGLLVTEGSIEVEPGGCFAVGSGCGAAVPPPVDSIVYLQGGDLHTAATGRASLERTFVHLTGTAATVGSGRVLIDDDPGLTGQLQWTAPTGGPFEDLLLWAESGDAMHVAGQQTFALEGVLFAPNAQVRLTPHGGATTAAAQVIAGRLRATGAGLLTLAPTPDRAVTNTARSVRLLR